MEEGHSGAGTSQTDAPGGSCRRRGRKTSPTAPWKTLRVFHELPQGLFPSQAHPTKTRKSTGHWASWSPFSQFRTHICRRAQVSVLTSSQTEQLVRWFDDLWWTGGRTRTDVEQMLRHSTIVAFADRDGGLAAFARVLSDRVYKALVLDVVVAEEQRGRGVGATLMDAVLAHQRSPRVNTSSSTVRPISLRFTKVMASRAKLERLPSCVERAAADTPLDEARPLQSRRRHFRRTPSPRTLLRHRGARRTSRRGWRTPGRPRAAAA